METGAEKKRKTGDMEEKGKKNLGHIIATAIGIVLCAILLPVVILNMTLVVKSYVNKDEVPTVFGMAPMVVQSGSMYPLIEVDDLIVTKKISTDNIVAGAKDAEIPGTVVAYLTKKDGRDIIITHRVIEIVAAEDGTRQFATQGDANNTPDDVLVREGQVVGEYFLRIKGAGRIAMFMKEPIGMVLFVGIPLGLFILYDAIRRALYSKKQRKVEQERIAGLEAALAGAQAAVPAEPQTTKIEAPESPEQKGESEKT